VTEASRAVFLSYASEDAATARSLAQALRDAGIEVWFDQSELRGGDAWDRQIRGQIHDCALFVALVSHHTEARTEGYFRREWRLAVDRTLDMADDARFLLPVVVDATDEAHARVPDKFRDVQWTRLRDGEAPTALIERIERLLEPAAVAGAPDGAPAARAAPARPARRAAWRSRPVLLAALLLAIGAGLAYVLAQRFAGPERGAAAPDATVATTGVNRNSIAVLPFIDMSERRDQEYFSDGLAEELLDLLARTPGLHVTARTSSFYFKGRQATVGEIAKTLGVAHLLEGSVRKSGSRLRVTTQLIRADTGEHVWSETYDRELKDVFAVQDEIATAVVGALKLRLGGSGAPLHSAGTSVPEAYDQLLLGRALLMKGSPEGAQQAIAALREALRLDPRFADAHAILASALTDQASPTDSATGYAAAAAAADRALSLDPALADGFVARSRLRFNTLDFAGARIDADQALRLAPGDVRALITEADVLAGMGEVDRALATYQEATTLDPVNRVAWSHLGNLLLATPDRAAARRALERALAISAESENAIIGLSTLDLLEGKAERARARTDQPRFTPTFRLTTLAQVEFFLGHPAESERYRKELVACCAAYSAYQVASVHAARHEAAQALDWLERALRQRDGGLASLKVDPWFDALRGEPRYAALLRALKLPP
jgi:TolB-like protein/tetratricopeptide (TPR) repeat protein